MNATTFSAGDTRLGSALLSIAGAAAIGLAVIVVAGHVQAATLHDAAHDTRHAAGFPCH